MNAYPFTPLAGRLPASVPFVGPEAQERAAGRAFEARLGANENGFGPSPKAVAALRDAATAAWKYGDPEAWQLRRALAIRHSIPVQRIVVGEGIDGLLGYLVRLLVREGVDVVTSDGAYPTFNYHVAGYGGTLHKVPYKDDREDLAGLAQAAREHEASLVYVSNPDNPMGTWHGAEAVALFARSLPDRCVLCLDEAYCEFAPSSAVPGWDDLPDNVLRMRTFSKAYGLAGMRVGYAIGHPDLVRAFDKVRNHFGLGGPAQVAATAAIGDDDHLVRTITDVARARKRICEIGSANGLVPIEGAANFQTLDTGRDGAYARALGRSLAESGIFVRMPFVAPQDRCIRVSAGPDDELDLFGERLPEALRSAETLA